MPSDFKFSTVYRANRIATPQTNFTQHPVSWWALLSSEVLYHYSLLLLSTTLAIEHLALTNRKKSITQDIDLKFLR